jgi:peptidoglycan/LPS O-acetylase OafA/YrhL
MALYYSTLSEHGFLKIISPINGLNPQLINAISGGWSIWNEIYFYILFPVYFSFRKSIKSVFIFALICLTLTNVIHFRIFDFGSPKQMADFDYLNIFNQIICFIVGVELMANNFKNILIFLITYFCFGLAIKILFFQEFFYLSDYGSSYYLSVLSIIAIVLLRFLSHLTIEYPIIFSSKIISLLGRIGQMTYTSYMLHFIFIDLIKRNNFFDFGTEINFLIISTVTFTVSYLIKPFTEDYFARLGYYLGERVIIREKGE